MLSKKSRMVIKLYFCWANLIKIFPYVYDSTENRLKLTDKIESWYIVSGVLVAHATFGIARIFYEYFAQDGKTEDFLFRFFFIAASGLGVTNQINAYFYKHQVVTCFNAFLELDRRCTKLYKIKDTTDICGLFVGIIFPVIVFSSCPLYAGLYIYNPKSPNYYNSLLPFAKYSVASLLMAIPEMIMFMGLWSSMYFSLLFVFTFQMSEKYWLEQIGVQNQMKNTRPKLRKPELAMLMFRQLQLLNKMFNNAMADFYQPVHSFLMGGNFVSSSFTAVRFYDKIHWFPYSMSPLTAAASALYHSVAYPTAAGVLGSSNNFKHSWKKMLSDNLPTQSQGRIRNQRLSEGTELLRFLRSCPTLGIRMGGQYVVDRNTIMTCLDILVDQTISMLVGVKQH